jgi:hypothetical protein
MPASQEKPTSPLRLRYGNEGIDVSLAEDLQALNILLNEPEIQDTKLVGFLELYEHKPSNSTWRSYLDDLQTEAPARYKGLCRLLCQRKDLVDIPLRSAHESMEVYRHRLEGYQSQAEKWVAKHGGR